MATALVARRDTAKAVTAASRFCAFINGL